jgi:hypothetical protein
MKTSCSLKVLSTLSASTIACWRLPPTPPLTAVALHPPPPLPNACACLGLSRKLECIHHVPFQLPLHFFLCPRIGGVEAMIASSPIVSSSSLLPCPAPHLLLPSFIEMAAILPVAPSSMADCCAFFITCTPSSLSFMLYNAIAGLCNVRSHLRKSKYQPLLRRLQSHSHPRCHQATSSRCCCPPHPPTLSSHGRHDTALIMGKSILENAIEATAHHPPPCWGKGGRSELTRRADKGDGRSVVQSMLVKMLLFFCSRINLAPAAPVQSAKIGYHTIA